MKFFSESDVFALKCKRLMINVVPALVIRSWKSRVLFVGKDIAHAPCNQTRLDVKV